jgi:hypothetical protein
MNVPQYWLQSYVRFAQEELTQVVHAVLLVREGDLGIEWVVE